MFVGLESICRDVFYVCVYVCMHGYRTAESVCVNSRVCVSLHVTCMHYGVCDVCLDACV